MHSLAARLRLRTMASWPMGCKFHDTRPDDAPDQFTMTCDRCGYSRTYECGPHHTAYADFALPDEWDYDSGLQLCESCVTSFYAWLNPSTGVTET